MAAVGEFSFSSLKLKLSLDSESAPVGEENVNREEWSSVVGLRKEQKV